MKVYLDNSFLNRPFDSHEIEMNRLESEILFFIIGLVKKKEIVFTNSSIIEYENSRNPFGERKAFIEEILKSAKAYQNLDEKIKKKALALENEFKIQPLDCLHLASAQFAKVDFFITCDYNLVKKYKGDLKVITPSDFIKHYENRYRK